MGVDVIGKISAGGLCLFLLIGCDDSSNVDDGVVKVADRTEMHVVSPTAIYFSDGAGVDFKRKPVSDRVSRSSINKKYRDVRYEFDEPYEDVDLAVAGILKAAGYERKLSPSKTGFIDVYYSDKQKKPVLFRYFFKSEENGVKKTMLRVWWYL